MAGHEVRSEMRGERTAHALYTSGASSTGEPNSHRWRKES